MALFAPLSFLRGHEPQRTSTWHLNPITMLDTQDSSRTFTIEYFTPTPRGSFFNKQTFPPRKGIPTTKDEMTVFTPPPHYHLLQDEYFKVESGSGIWHLWGGKEVTLKAGDEIMVPARSWHWFENDSLAEEPLVVSFRYEAEYEEMEERFFRNVIGYMDDCRVQGVPPSVLQLLVFCMYNCMPLGIVPRVGPEWVALGLDTVLMVVLGCWARFVLGYKGTYPEYYMKELKKTT